MPETKCGFDSGKGFSGCDLLVTYDPTLVVNIGFDPDYNPQAPKGPPVLAVTGLRALVDTGATESCIDNLLAVQLNLSIVDRRPISGVHGRKEANMYLAQVHIPTLNFTIYGAFAGVDLLVLIPMKVVGDSDLILVTGSEVKPIIFGAKRRWHSYRA